MNIELDFRKLKNALELAYTAGVTSNRKEMSPVDKRRMKDHVFLALTGLIQEHNTEVIAECRRILLEETDG